MTPSQYLLEMVRECAPMMKQQHGTLQAFLYGPRVIERSMTHVRAEVGPLTDEDEEIALNEYARIIEPDPAKRLSLSETAIRKSLADMKADEDKGDFGERLEKREENRETQEVLDQMREVRRALRKLQ